MGLLFKSAKRHSWLLWLVVVTGLLVLLLNMRHFLMKSVIWEEHLKIAWLDLIPQAELEAASLVPMPVIERNLESNLNYPQDFNVTVQRPATEAVSQHQAVSAYNQQAVALPGFVVPLTYNKQGRVTEFFLVPYFGACINLPPPPANQIVFVTYAGGMEEVELYEPQWVAGYFNAEQSLHEGVSSHYIMQAQTLKPYEQEDSLPANGAVETTPETKPWLRLKPQVQIPEPSVP